MAAGFGSTSAFGAPGGATAYRSERLRNYNPNAYKGVMPAPRPSQPPGLTANPMPPGFNATMGMVRPDRGMGLGAQGMGWGRGGRWGQQAMPYPMPTPISKYPGGYLGPPVTAGATTPQMLGGGWGGAALPPPRNAGLGLADFNLPPPPNSLPVLQPPNRMPSMRTGRYLRAF